MKQKALRFLVPFLLLTLLAGCGNTGTDGKTETRGIDVERSYTHYYNSLTATETEDTIYFSGVMNPFISYVDKATGIGGVLCGKPECLHNNKDCNGFLADRTDKLFIAGDRLCWLSEVPQYSVSDSQWFISVYSMALDGTDRREVRRIDAEYLHHDNSSGISFKLYHDGVIYYATVEEEVEDGEDTYYNYVCAIPTDPNQEPTVLLRERAGYSYNILLHFYDGYLYILTNNKSNFGTVTEGEKLYDFRLRRLNVETGETETLCEDLETPMNFSDLLWATDESVFFDREILSDQISKFFYRYDFATGTFARQPEFELPEGFNACLADGLDVGYKFLSNNHDGTYDFHITIRDFAGETLVDETYSLDLGYRYYNNGGFHFSGRDENYAYFHFVTTYSVPPDWDGTLYTSMIAVALYGSGVRELCTVSNNAP